MTDEQFPPAPPPPPPTPAKALYGRGTLAAVTIAVVLYAGITLWKKASPGQRSATPEISSPSPAAAEGGAPRADTPADTPLDAAPGLVEMSTVPVDNQSSQEQ